MTARYARATLFASPQARQQAAQLAPLLDRPLVLGRSITVTEAELGDDLRRLLFRLLEIISDGGTITVGELPEVLTTTVAADLLGVTRTTLMKHVRSGAVPSFLVGSHTKLRRDDVLEFRRQRQEQQRATLENLLAQPDPEDG